jgi:hypothetical protein
LGYEDLINRSKDNVAVTAFPQTRAGKKEWIQPMAFFERDSVSGLYLPPGESSAPSKPRVDVSGSSVNLNGSLSKVVVQDCTVANTEYTIDVNTLLGHNGRGGFIKSATTNTGVISMAFSQDGATFGTYIPDVQPGDAYSLDGIDLDSIKVKSTVAGDDVIVEVH